MLIAPALPACGSVAAVVRIRSARCWNSWITAADPERSSSSSDNCRIVAASSCICCRATCTASTADRFATIVAARDSSCCQSEARPGDTAAPQVSDLENGLTEPIERAVSAVQGARCLRRNRLRQSGELRCCCTRSCRTRLPVGQCSRDNEAERDQSGNDVEG